MAGSPLAQPSLVALDHHALDVSAVCGTERAAGLILGPCRFWSIFAALLVIAAIPVLRTDVPPLLDYPNHFARMYLLTDSHAAEELRRYYQIQWQANPNLAMDLLIPPLARLLTLVWATKVFIIASFGLMAAGAALIHRAFTGHWSMWPLFAFLFLYSRMFLLGFLGYLFGLGLALIAFAVWVALAERPLILRVAVSVTFALALYFAHLMACAIYGLMVVGYEAGVALERRAIGFTPLAVRFISAGLAFVPPLALQLAFHTLRVHQPIVYDDDRLLFVASVFDNYNAVFDFTALGLLALATAIGVATRHLVWPPPMAGPFWVLFAAFLVAPSLAFGVWGIAERIPIAFFLVLTAVLSPGGAGLRPRVTRLIGVAGLALYFGRMTVVAVEWDQADAYYAKRIAILDQVPEGGRLAVAYPSDLAVSISDFYPIAHLPLLAIPERHAFVPTLFTNPGQQPVALTPEAVQLQASAPPSTLWTELTETSGADPRTTATLSGFDAVLLLDYRTFNVHPPRSLELISGLPDFALYRVVH